MRVQRYDFFLNHQNFSKKKSLFSCIFYALLIYVNTQNDLHLIIYYIGRAVLAKSQEQRTELQTQEKPSTPFWLVISSILLFTGCAVGILFIKNGEARKQSTRKKGRFMRQRPIYVSKTKANIHNRLSRRKTGRLLKCSFLGHHPSESVFTTQAITKECV